MQSKLIALVLVALAVSAVASFAFVTSPAFAAGLNNEKNFGQCKKDFPNGGGCGSTVKPGNG